MKIDIDESFLTSITIHKEWSIFDRKKDLTNEDLMKILKGEDRCSSTSSDDHPEFAKLRNKLEEDRYIKTNRNSWNGDEVLKPFTLNNFRFKKGERFPCGAAIRGHLKFSKKYGR